MTDDKPKKFEPPLHLDMEFGEALARYAQTKPEEVKPPKGKKKKKAKLKMLKSTLPMVDHRTVKTEANPRGKKR